MKTFKITVEEEVLLGSTVSRTIKVEGKSEEDVERRLKEGEFSDDFTDTNYEVENCEMGEIYEPDISEVTNGK